MTAERVEQRTPSPRLFESGELPPILRDPSQPTPRKPFRPVHFGIKTVLFVFVFYFFILPLIPGFRHAAEELLDVEPLLLIVRHRPPGRLVVGLRLPHPRRPR